MYFDSSIGSRSLLIRILIIGRPGSEMANSNSNVSKNGTGSFFGDRSDATIVAQWLSLAVLGVIIVFGNLASIITFVKTPSLRKKPHYLIISLSVADLFVGMVDFMATYYFSSERKTAIFLMSLEVLDHLFAVASILTLAMISVERFLAVNYPFHHRRLQFKVYVLLIAFPWVAAVIGTILDSLSVAIIIGTNVCHYLSLILPAVALVIIFFSYIGIGTKTCQKSHQIKKQAVRDRRLVVTLLIVTVASLVTWLPHQIFYIIFFFCKTCGRPTLDALFVTKFLQFANSGLNVFIYIARIPDFRTAFLALFCGKVKSNNPASATRNAKVESSSGIANSGFANDKSYEDSKSKFQNGKVAETKLQKLQTESLVDACDCRVSNTNQSNVKQGALNETARDDVPWGKPGQNQNAFKSVGTLERADDTRYSGDTRL